MTILIVDVAVVVEVVCVELRKVLPELNRLSLGVIEYSEMHLYSLPD